MNGLPAQEATPSDRRPTSGNPGRVPSILDHASTLADLTRCRILALLDRHELTVSELCSVLQLPQSTVSRHLKHLAGGGWVGGRRQGTCHLYRLEAGRLMAPARALWELVRPQLADAETEGHDQARLASVLAERGSRSQAFFSSSAGRWDQLRAELFGQRFDLLALAGLLDATWRVGDLACGTGTLAAALAPFVAQVIAIDASAAMLGAARDRLDRFANVEVKPGALEALPIEDRSLDAATLVLALHHVAEPRRALAEVARVLAPGGRLLLVDMVPHEREAFRQDMGHRWLGFSAQEITAHLRAAGLEPQRHQSLPPDPAALGPNLFVATAGAPLEPCRSSEETTPRTHATQP